jgi:hypothetical protein
LKVAETCQWIELTGGKEWKPHSESFAEKERLILTTQSEPYSTWQIKAELANRELKKTVRY